MFENKPFRPPLIQKPVESNNAAVQPAEPPLKKRKVEGATPPRRLGVTNAQLLAKRLSGQAPSMRDAPLMVPVKKAAPAETSPVSLASAFPETFYSVLWRKPSNKKHKTWDGDAILILRDGFAELRDLKGREMGKIRLERPLLPGSTLSMSGKEIEVESSMSKDEYFKMRGGSTQQPSSSPAPNVPQQPLQKADLSPPPPALPSKELLESRHKPPQAQIQTKLTALPSMTKQVSTPRQYKNPLLNPTTMPKGDGETPVPRHDSNAPDAIVMNRPPKQNSNRQVVDVVIDPFIGKHLRKHQREGVKFLYDCVMGFKGLDCEGAILADEMGLGKTLQIITLLWTLMKQNPTWGQQPVVKKALIVCPVGTIDNWRKEFRKWLGNERLGVFVYNDKDKRIKDFTRGKSYHIMIIGYERLRKAADELINGGGVDIVVMDEGHRLKTAKDKSAQAIKSLNCDKRIVLSGTILQNNLSELFFVVDLISPGLLGKASAFKRQYQDPIERGSEPEAPQDVKEYGEEKKRDLMEITSTFTLRRTTAILAKYLPPKSEYVLFCKPTQIQASVYQQVLKSPSFSAILGSSEATLQLINILKKVCNSPHLLRDRGDDEPTNPVVSALLSEIPPKLLSSPSASGKLRVLDSLLHAIRTTTDEKVVIVSNYTSTLDILGKLLTALSYPFARLDGATPGPRRQALIDTFNRAPASSCFAFLLSAKSGGVGINLIGASRLVLFDVDWNPATDLQAMARIHREGQRRHARIYRLLTLGALDEKIYQRQLVKMSLADAVVDGKLSVAGFTRHELRRLFQLDTDSSCGTHDLLGCACAGRGDPGVEEKEKVVEEVQQGRKEEAAAFVPASQLDRDDELRTAAERAARNKMLSLMQYKHVDAEVVTGDGNVGEDEQSLEEILDEDEVLARVLRDPENRVRYLFAKTTSAESVAAAEAEAEVQAQMLAEDT